MIAPNLIQDLSLDSWELITIWFNPKQFATLQLKQNPHQNAGMAMTAINFFTMAGVAVFLQGMGALMKILYPGASLGVSAFKSAFILSSSAPIHTTVFHISLQYMLIVQIRLRNLQ